ncbi:TPA: hypothetical protein HA281_04015 [Candidatus Woesearchaeota archaeon]|nr:hypothetical protein [Candidatus Woesearchaeota archaeon]HIH91944.1 hypothetical protein [Candidatus Woesearchaeota archaeon]HII65943.1 hypothetical protein [Candidatus Woesearchaeota archaeon]
MQEATYKLARNALWALALTGSVAVYSAVYSGFNYLSTKNTNEHYAAHAEVDTKKIKAIDDLLSNPAYAAYIAKRQELATVIESQSILPMGYLALSRKIDAIAGPFEPSNLPKK